MSVDGQKFLMVIATAKRLHGSEMNAFLPKILRMWRATVLLATKLALEPFVLFRKASVRMTTLDGMRYPYFLATAFATQGAIVIPVRELGRARRLFGFSRVITNFRIWPTKKIPCLAPEETGGEHDILVVENYFDDSREGDFSAPYFAHPDFYLKNFHTICKTLRKARRRARVFFAGTHSPGSYRNEFLFPMLSRTEIVEHLSARFAIAADELAEISTEGGNRLVFSLTSDTQNTIAKHKLGLREYLEKLADSDFFLCPPGYMVPHSHNIVEAMSVGAVPICNYGHLMRPPLIDGVNCIGFETLEDLDAAFERIDRLDEADIARLRRGAVDYYDAYLDPSAFARNFLAEAHRTRRLLVNAAESDKSSYLIKLRGSAARAQASGGVKSEHPASG